MPFHPFGEALMMYSKYDEAQFHLRLTHELHAKIKQRAKMNNRSINSEIVATMEESLSKPSPVSGYRDEEERLASLISERVKEVVADILRKRKNPQLSGFSWLVIKKSVRFFFFRCKGKNLYSIYRYLFNVPMRST